MTEEFNKWWDEDDLTTQGNNFTEGTPAYWAWEGWQAGIKAEREACALLIEENVQECNGLTGLVLQSNADAIRARGNT